jgi:Protein of unknown function (DUF4199)
MKKSTVILMWGGITAIACAIHKAILVWEEISISGWAYFNFLIFFLGLFIGIRQYREKVNNGYLKFGQGYVVSLLMTLIVTIVGLINVIITLQIIPDLGDRLQNELTIRLVNSGLSQDTIDKIMSSKSNGFTPKMIIINSLLGNLIIGAILGLIATGINTKLKPLFDDTNDANTNEINN